MGSGRSSNDEVHVLDFRAVETEDGWAPAWTKIRRFTANYFAIFKNRLIYDTDDGYVCVD